MELLKGADVAAVMNTWMKQELEKLEGEAPKLAILRVGENPDDLSYERGAKKRMEKIGLRCETYVFPANISHQAFAKEFQKINEDADVTGILLLRPLPEQIDEQAIVAMIDPLKDLDGISPANMAKLYMGDDTGFAPCTAEAVIEMLDYAGVRLQGKNVVVIGRSLVIGKPAAQLLMQRNATVTVVHSRSVNSEEICRRADVLVVAAGKKKLVNAAYVKEGGVVIDVGIHYDPDTGKMCGDADTESVGTKASVVTPVPGGVGAVTTSMLASHLIRAAKLQGKMPTE